MILLAHYAAAGPRARDGRGERWSVADIDTLYRMVGERQSLKAVMAALKRSKGSVMGCCRRHGLSFTR